MAGKKQTKEYTEGDRKPIGAVLNCEDSEILKKVSKDKGLSFFLILCILIDNFNPDIPVEDDRAIILGKRWHEDKSKVQKLNFVLPLELKTKIEQMAKSNKTSESVVLRHIIHDYIQGIDTPREFVITLY